MTNKKVTRIEVTADQKIRRVPNPKTVTVTFDMDEDLAEKLKWGNTGYNFDFIDNEDKIRRLAPILWEQLERELERWQQRSGGPLDPNR